MATLENEIKTKILKINKFIYFRNIYLLKILFVKTKKYKRRKKPANEFGWEKVPYGLKNSIPLMVALAIPGVDRVNNLSPKK